MTRTTPTAAELIAGLGEPTRDAQCHIPGCTYRTGKYYNPGDARASMYRHMRQAHNIGETDKADAVKGGARVRNYSKA